MFTALHALAQSSTLMIAISTDGEQLRVSITPTPADDKKKQALRPLSLVGTPEELDTGFAEAIAIWQAPKKSLAEQAKEAAEAPDDDDNGKSSKPAASKSSAKTVTTSKPATKAPIANKAAAKPASTPAKKQAAKASAKSPTKQGAKADKSTRTVLDPAAQWPFPCREDTPPAADSLAPEEPQDDERQAPDEPAPNAAITTDSEPAAPAEAAPAIPPSVPEAETPPADTFTLELF